MVHVKGDISFLSPSLSPRVSNLQGSLFGVKVISYENNSVVEVGLVRNVNSFNVSLPGRGINGDGNRGGLERDKEGIKISFGDVDGSSNSGIDGARELLSLALGEPFTGISILLLSAELLFLGE